MIDCWKILKIEPTTDERAIRRAYAKILKTIDQDTQPADFIELREAMQQALDRARYMEWDETDDEEDWETATSTTSDQSDPATQPKTDADADAAPFRLDAAQDHSFESVADVAEPTAEQAEFSFAWTTEHPIERQHIQLNPSSSAVPIWQEWQPNQKELRKLQRDAALLRERFWAGQYDTASYQALHDILQRLPDQSLAVQMELQEQLAGVLAWCPEQAETERFIQLWVETFGLQKDAVGLDASSMQLQQRWTVLEARQGFWRSMPIDYHKDLRQLADGSRLAWWSMWRLSGAKHPRILGLKNIHWHGVPYRDTDRQRNLALQLLLRVRPNQDYQKSFLLVYGVNALFLLYVLDVPTLIAIVLSVAIGWSWHSLLLAPLSAWIAVKSQITPIYRAGLFGVWLFSGMLLLLSSVVLPASVLMVAVWVWATTTSLWMAEAELYSPTPSLLRCLSAEPNIKADRWMIGLMSLAAVATIGWVLVELFAYLLGADLSWVIRISFTLLFFMLVWFRSYVLDQLKVPLNGGGDLVDRWIAYAKEITSLLGFFGMLLFWCFPIAMIMALLNLPKFENAALMSGANALFSVAALTLVLLIPRSEMLSYLMRHLSYLAGLIAVYALWVVTGETTIPMLLGLFAIPAGLLGWYWYQSAAADWPSE